MDTLSLPIAQQPRLVLVLPAALVVLSVFVASVVALLLKTAGASQALVVGSAVLCLVLGIALAIASSTGSQGEVRVTPGDTLEVFARWRGGRHLPLDDATEKRFVWKRGRPAMLVGVYIKLQGRGDTITIGSWDAALAEQFSAAGAEPSTVPPSIALAPEHFRRLLAALTQPAGAAGREF